VRFSADHKPEVQQHDTITPEECPEPEVEIAALIVAAGASAPLAMGQDKTSIWMNPHLYAAPVVTPVSARSVKAQEIVTEPRVIRSQDLCVYATHSPRFWEQHFL